MKNLLILLVCIISCLSCSSEKDYEAEGDENYSYALFNAELRDKSIIFQIPDTLLGRDILLVSRIAQAPTDFDPLIVAGSKRAEQLVYWEKHGNHILLRAKTSDNISSEDDPIHLAVTKNSLDPVLERFQIRKNILGGKLYRINVTPMFVNHRMLLSGWNTKLAKVYGKSKLDRDRSWTESVRGFPANVEIQQFMTYSVARMPTADATGWISLLMNYSFILLPKEPMPVREYDPGMGWFTIQKDEYASDISEVRHRKFIQRWHLVPNDLDAYQYGELVEPIQPIVFYLDPATPLKWRPYFKKGVEAWNACFETAGFKNAIVARDPPDPQSDPDFHPEDVRYSVIRYVTNTTRNATGPRVVDPRSGQILESDIIWYHNVLDWLRNRYLIETGATNPDASQLFLPDEVMGELISYVISHEVGHALGLSHNMKASSAYPVDSLRSPSFTSKYGITPTLMDYARFNYITQPGDGAVEYIAKIGPYDHYAIDWGYRYASSKHEALTKVSIRNDHFIYQFGKEQIEFDPTIQTEGLGDDNIKASRYAVDNLQIVMDSILEWTSIEGADFSHLSNLHKDLLLMWYRYQKHVLMNIGGVYENQKKPYERGAVFTYVEGATQRQALAYLLENAFIDQNWLVPSDIVSRIYPEGVMELVIELQKQLLDELLYPERLQRMIENEAHHGSSAYTIDKLLNELNRGFWLELHTDQPLDHTRQVLQRHYISRLIFLYQAKEMKGLPSWQDSDIVTATYAALAWIQDHLRSNINRRNAVADPDYWHYKNLLRKVEQGISGFSSIIEQNPAINISTADKMVFGCYY